MAISEACKFEIEDSVDKACKEKGISKAEAFRALEKFYNGIGVAVSFSTIKKKYQRAKKGTNVPIAKPPKQHTKPEIKIQISEVAEEIRGGNVSDDDTKVIGDALADAITEGKAAIRVATKAATAVKKKLGKKKKPSKLKTNFERLSNHCQMFTDGLQHWADKEMQPETKDEAIEAKTVLDSAPNIIMQYSRLGIDIGRILEIAQGGSIEMVGITTFSDAF